MRVRTRAPGTDLNYAPPPARRMRIGCHVSIAGGIDRAVDNAAERGCTAFQIFTRSPRMWRAKEISAAERDAYRAKLDASGIDRSATCAHMPYLPNLASGEPDAYRRSVAVLVEEVGRCGELGVPYLVTHLGSHLGEGEEAGIARLVAAYGEAAAVDNRVRVLLENTAGQKNSVGSDFGQLGSILRQLEPADRFGVCIDTCHAFVHGYDLRTEKAVGEAFAELDTAVGAENLRMLHLNDAKGGLGSKLDRHHHVGLGGIGEEGMRAVVREAHGRDVPVILETPIDGERDDFGNIRAARGLLE